MLPFLLPNSPKGDKNGCGEEDGMGGPETTLDFLTSFLFDVAFFYVVTRLKASRMGVWERVDGGA